MKPIDKGVVHKDDKDEVRALKRIHVRRPVHSNPRSAVSGQEKDDGQKDP